MSFAVSFAAAGREKGHPYLLIPPQSLFWKMTSPSTLRSLSDAVELLERRFHRHQPPLIDQTGRTYSLVMLQIWVRVSFAFQDYDAHWRLCRRISHQTFCADTALTFRPVQPRRAREMITNTIDDPDRYVALPATTPEKAIFLKLFPSLWCIPDWLLGSSLKREAKTVYDWAAKTVETPHQYAQEQMKCDASYRSDYTSDASATAVIAVVGSC
ncbi:hypothetical protein BDN67DRAFT_1028834 [Paxillus ammoniavirescens]|nr:hypothetical protein BDN67DRAFT_1028834 [Paxillus ammoniavirescens]